MHQRITLWWKTYADKSTHLSTRTILRMTFDCLLLQTLNDPLRNFSLHIRVADKSFKSSFENIINMPFAIIMYWFLSSQTYCFRNFLRTRSGPVFFPVCNNCGPAIFSESQLRSKLQIDILSNGLNCGPVRLPKIAPVNCRPQQRAPINCRPVRLQKIAIKILPYLYFLWAGPKNVWKIALRTTKKLRTAGLSLTYSLTDIFSDLFKNSFLAFFIVTHL